ncbi:hypothetical protein C499_11928 [Halogeometricum borinquense DSM 11551]|uniref:Uncharacterized protein n=1 Tax=Halogeometricum borinquense (strain ATCC 700274 / DSM 11551 / JCM 10706 / KCTC 4070 / PR3) TaxID=469382 RepID=E4NTG5_HALBP|nr:hypothetical protein [Halogeometricum borinquense]ADQ65910.1 hypothetical protein Hbor_03000 [Halogeometricum borinquense DSM 11551]ELY26268.1 hypothetical protein C499_11928 [Halogeometricum borinquense DSM 11551]
MAKIEYDGRELTVGTQTVVLRHKIGQVLEEDGIILVVLSPSQTEGRDQRNLLAFDEQGNKLWESEIPEHSERHMFGEIYKENGDIIGWSWNSNEYKIDLETGALENIGYGGK